MNMKLVDTSAWVEFLRRKGDPVVKQKVARLLEANLAAYTCPIRFELLGGVRSEEQADLDATLAFSHHIPFNREDWRDAALLERELRAKGLNIPRNDLFVATVALRTGLTLTCRDTHFELVRQLTGEKLKIEQM